MVYQSARTDYYRAALEKLEAMQLVYPCVCTRSSLARHRGTHPAPPYPGICRDRAVARQGPHALRIRTPGSPIAFDDAIQGPFHQTLSRDVGDFVVRRRDDAYAYHLAVVVDDHAQGVSDVMRGVDLLDSTPRQIFVQRCLDMATPAYSHLPVIVDENGVKLSKQSRARAVDHDDPPTTLFYLLERLNHAPPPDLRGADPDTLLAWAIAHWDSTRLARIRTIPLDSGNP